MKKRVLILCTGNSARSQIAEGLLRSLADDAIEVCSAGTQPTSVHPLAIETMREIGVDISRQRSKSVREYAGQHFDTVITVCDTAAEHCPLFPGTPDRIHWNLPDPASAKGTPEQRLAFFRSVRAQLEQHLREFAGAKASPRNS